MASAGPPTKKQIDALASHGDLTFAASESSIYVYKRAKEIKVLRIDDGDDEGSYTVSHLMIMGDLILALCSDNVLRMWNFRTFEYYNEISFGSTFRATTMIHPSTYLNKVLIASQEGRMQIWNIHTMRLIYDFPKSFGSPITILAQSPVVDVIAVGMLDGRIILHNIKFDQEVISVKQEDKVTGISFRTDEQPLMASANMHGDVALWDLDERRLFNVMRGAHDGAVVSTFFLNGQPLLITVGGDNSVKCWIFDTLDGTPRLLKSRSGHHGPPSMIRFYDEEGRFLLSSGRDRSLKLFSLFRDAQNTEFSQGSIEKKSKKLGMKIDELKLSQILHFASSPAKEKQWSNIVTCHANDASARTWDFRNKAIGKHVLTASDNATVKAVTISPCGNFAYIGSSKGKIDMFNMQSGLHRKTFHSEQGHFKSIVGLAVDSVNRVLISGSLDQALIFWDVRSGKAISSMKFSTPISAITLHKDSGLVAVTCDDLCVRIVDIDTRKVVREFWGHRNRIMDCAFSPDGRWLVSTSLDGTIRTWDLPTGHLVDCFRTASIATSVAFSPTGDFLASVHVDELGIFLWSNRAQFKNVALKNIQDDDAIFVSLPSPTGATEDAETKGDSASRVPDEDNMDESADLSVPDDSLIALSDVPATRWQTLLNIEAIKKRNKPKEPPKAPVKAPFFLSAAGPSQSVPDKEHSSSDAENAPKSRIFNSTSSSMIFSDFVERLRAGHEDNDFTEFWKYVRTLSPSALDFEIRSMDVETGDISDVSFFIEALKFQLRTKKDFELVEAYLAVLLKVRIFEDEDVFVLFFWNL
ncbi:hypothetical protein HK102_010969 [Quaeritorhiza haematococci]|nr:hypothetical protein HK102_010969 [Quaeritorhiza haematococci]